jgi:hypothetical protein
VKTFGPRVERARRCRRSGLDVTVMETPTYFQYGTGSQVSVR